MTIDEFIDYFKNISADDLDAIGFTFTETQQLAEWLEERKACKVALELACEIISVYEIETEELKIYKKALELLAEDSTNSSLNEDTQELMDYYLQKARK